MPEDSNASEYLVDVLQERAKELNCLYQIDDILNNEKLNLAEMLEQTVSAIPSGFRFPDICRARIVYENRTYQTADFFDTDISETAHIRIDGKAVGIIEAVYIEGTPPPVEGGGHFLDKERKLLRTIAERIAQTALYRHLKQMAGGWAAPLHEGESKKGPEAEWKVIIDLLLRTDPEMLLHVCRKMINHLSRSALKDSDKLPCLFSSSVQQRFSSGEVNAPGDKASINELAQIGEETFSLASKHMGDHEISLLVHRWIREEKAGSLIKAVDRVDISLDEIVEAITRYHNLLDENSRTLFPSERWLEVALIRRFLSDNLDFIRVARPFLEIDDFHEIASHLIYPSGSHGKIGGKAAGIFVAQRIINSMSDEIPYLKTVKVPKTWYIAADEIKEFLQYNNLQGLNEQKYKDLEEIRIEYPDIIQLLKNARFPPGLLKSLALALDDFGERPLIIRSSSLLEDQVGAAFSGKYKSLFLANQGDKKQRLEAVMDAITEIYASMYSPDSIQYRAEKGMIDFHEEMGILIQEVVGRRVGPYFMPLFAGVAFSNNEYRWSPRIKREDGLVRMVMGLGTRAVDRLTDDFPILVSPGQPALRVNTMPEEIMRYSPRKADVLNLETNTFESIDLSAFLKEYGHLVPGIANIVSIYKDDYIHKPSLIELDFAEDNLIVTFEGFTSNSAFIKTIGQMLQVLSEKMQVPVDMEFAFDGDNLYLLQCRSQNPGVEGMPGLIPRDVDEKDIVFTAKRHIANGVIPDISHIVYVDPDGYDHLKTIDEYIAVGRAVGRINAMLPKRRFILMGPGRWGSRGDIKLGVQISYSDINKAALIAEIAKKKTNYVPELSFGTHFFQDLVEANIRYLPLYPDDEGIVFNSHFLDHAKNVLPLLLPDYAHLGDVLKVIEIPASAGGKLLQIAMNAEIGEAIGFLAKHKGKEQLAAGTAPSSPEMKKDDQIRHADKFWRWRLFMAECIVKRLDPVRFGVRNAYLTGSVNSGTAGPGSDIDLILHFQGNAEQRAALELWLQGWSVALAEINYLKTGYTSDGLLDAHIITDEDIAANTSFAHKISAVTDPATPLPLAVGR